MVRLTVIVMGVMCLSAGIVMGGNGPIMPEGAEGADVSGVPGGLLPLDLPEVDGVPARYRDGVEPPGHWDWRDVRGTDWMTPVKNQAGCGACAAFAACGAVEAMFNLRMGDPEWNLDLSEQHVFACADGECASGLYMGTVFDYFVNPGIPDEACWPYQALDLPCSDTCPDWQSRVTRLDGWNLLWTWTPDTELLRRAVWWQPIAVYMEVYTDFSGYSGGVYKYNGTSAYRGGHFVVIVGWDDAGEYWICKNSWGTGWGESGYFLIAWEEVEIGTWAMDPHWSDPGCDHTGDGNGDGMVTAGDAQMAFQVTLGLIPITAAEACHLDCSGDDAITAADAQSIFIVAIGAGGCATEANP
ncbi:hypothetical protein JXA80_06590 [bacterium]|nr:hypothetical protein [candidate division CSSED10-310 bacterium]